MTAFDLKMYVHTGKRLLLIFEAFVSSMCMVGAK